MRALKCAITLCLAVLLVGCEYLLPPDNEPLVYRPATRSVQAFKAVSSTPCCDLQVMATKRQMVQILKKVNSVYSVRGNGVLKICGLAPRKLLQTDSWGHPYRLKPTRPAPDASGAIMAGFILISVGPDGRFGTGDDVRWEGDLLPVE